MLNFFKIFKKMIQILSGFILLSAFFSTGCIKVEGDPSQAEVADDDTEEGMTEAELQAAFLLALQNGGSWTSACAIGVFATDFTSTYSYDGSSLTIVTQDYASNDLSCSGAARWHSTNTYQIVFPSNSHDTALETTLAGAPAGTVIDYAYKTNLVLSTASYTMDSVAGANLFTFLGVCGKNDWGVIPGVAGTYDAIAGGCATAGTITYTLMGIDEDNGQLHNGDSEALTYDGTTNAERPRNLDINPLYSP